MRYAILSDVHANLEALTAAVATAHAHDVDRVLFLGDLVGYYASPNECVDLVRALGFESVAGNHDRAAARLFEPDRFGRAGRHALYWTRRTLAPRNVRFLAALPTTKIVDDRFVLFHAALHPSPDVHTHLDSAGRIRKSMLALARSSYGVRMGFFGHTHRAGLHELDARGMFRSTPASDVEIAIDPESIVLVNPGSVGQPRDGDLRAAFAVFDDAKSTVRFERVAYDRARFLDRVRSAGLGPAASTHDVTGAHAARSLADRFDHVLQQLRRRLG